MNRCRPPEARERRRKRCLHSVDSGVAPHHRSPASAMKPARHDLWAPFGREAIEHLARAMRLSPPRSFHVLDAERQASFDYEGGAHRHHALEHSAQGIALTEALVPRTAEDRMIGDLSSMPSLQNHL